MISSDDRCHPVILSLFFACWFLVSVVFYNLRRDLWHQNSTVGRLHALLHDDSCVGLRCLEDPILSGREKLPFILGEPMHLKRNHPENVPQNRHWNQFDFTPTRPNMDKSQSRRCLGAWSVCAIFRRKDVGSLRDVAICGCTGSEW